MDQTNRITRLLRNGPPEAVVLRDWVRKGKFQMQLLGPGLVVSSALPYKLPKRLANEPFSILLTMVLDGDSIFGIWRRGEVGSTTAPRATGAYGSQPKDIMFVRTVRLKNFVVGHGQAMFCAVWLEARSK